MERVESEVVLICEGYNKEGRVRHAVLGCEEGKFWERHMKPDSMTQVLSHARKITCAGVRRMRGLSVVFIPPRSQRNRHCL